ncbi:MAG: glycosyltransferase [Campylobacterales bacterium]|nr:glycosyltransferase [Campylobacterales bacterium]
MVESNNEYAPILVVVYDRLNHFKKCIESLKSCNEARDSVLYIASDAAYRDEDLEKVELVRKYVKTIDGFKEVVPIFRSENVGAVKNINTASEQIFHRYENLIAMEDDVVVGKGFLKFMNDGLHVYRDNPKVVAICGYLAPGIESEDGQPFFLNRFAPYGAATWRDKERLLDSYRTPGFFDECFRDFSFFKEYEKISPHCVRAIPLLIHGGRSFGDIEKGIVMQKNGLLALYPSSSITKSIGHDNSGLHSKYNPELQLQAVSDKVYKDLNVKKIENNKHITLLNSSYRRKDANFLINYIIYVFHKYVPNYFIFYSFIRKIYKKLN